MSTTVITCRDTSVPTCPDVDEREIAALKVFCGERERERKSESEQSRVELLDSVGIAEGLSMERVRDRYDS